MGGFGSTRWAGHDKAKTVEDSLVLDSGTVSRDLLRTTRGSALGTIRWTVRDREVGSVGLWVRSRDEAGAHASLTYNVNGKPVEVPLRLVTTRTPLGGLRWWWCCPVAGCGKRARKLYLPPGESVFACRTCHRLTYTSVQEHDARVDALVRGGVKSLLLRPPEDEGLRDALLRLKAQTRIVEKMRRREAR